MTPLTIIAIILILIWLYRLLTPSNRLKRMADAIPGPKGWPIVGNSFLYWKGNQFLRITMELCKTYGPVTRVWFGKQLFIMLADPQDIELFLTTTKHMNKTHTYRLLDSWLGTKNLLTSDEDVWKPHRKLLTPSFHFKILESSVEVMRKNADVLCEQLALEVDGEEFDILPYSEKCSLDIIGEAAMGVKLDTQKTSDSSYLHAVRSLTTILVVRASSPWLFNEYIFRFSPVGRIYYTELKKIKSIVHQIIEERKTSLLEEKESGASAGTTQRQAKPFLHYLLLESNFTDEEIENEVQTFMFAGHDTTMTTIAFCLYALSKHPDVQEKVYREIQDVLTRDSKQELTYQDYNSELRYLDNVLKETMRKYTTVPLISRKVSEDLRLSSGYTLPKGSWANFFLYRMHNDERYFPNPDLYLPERFENKENMVNYSFIPFSAGPRNCIGQKFAMLEMKVIISTLIQKYRFLPSEKQVKELTVETGVVLRSLDKTPMRLTRRERFAT